MHENQEDLIIVGQYVIVKKQNYSKLYNVSEHGVLKIGKDQVHMQEIIGKPYWTTFEMIPSRNGKRDFSLKIAPMTESWEDLMSTVPSGIDNRSITDDGTSQKLSKEEILELQESGKSGKEIIGTLIENSTSFIAKTEYSQKKYIKKKERKYFRYLIICKPTITLLQDIYFRGDHNKTGGLRIDTIAQLLSYCDIQSNGLFMLYDSGSMGLIAATMLNRIGASTSGTLIHLHPGNIPQTTMIKAMNFPKEQMDRLVTVNLYSFLRLYYQADSSVLENNTGPEKVNDINLANEKTGEVNIDNTNSKKTEVKLDQTININTEVESNIENSEVICKLEENLLSEGTDDTEKINSVHKRKLDELNEIIPAKKLKVPKWLIETQSAVDFIKKEKVSGIAIVAKEHPLNIIESLLPFLGLSRPFVIFHMYREPLQETYIALKQNKSVINLRLFSNFLRSYQVLPDRTHPDNLMRGNGGYLLTGYLVE